MSIFKRVLQSVKTGTGKVVGYNAVRDNATLIGKLLKVLTMPSPSSVKCLMLLPANYEAFNNAMKTHGVNERILKKIHRNYVSIAYIGIIGLAISLTVMIQNGGFSYLVGVGASFICTAVWLRGAYSAFCINYRHCDGFLKFITSPTEYFPNPFFYKVEVKREDGSDVSVQYLLHHEMD